MGNHTIDCAFCGADQRLVGTRCCKEYIAQEDAKEAALRVKRSEQWAYLKKFGIDPSYNDYWVHIDEVVKAFQRLEKQL